MNASSPTVLGPEDVRSFDERGYVILRGVFDAVELDAIRAAFDRLADEAKRLASSGMHKGAQFVIERRYGWRKPPSIHRVVWCGACEPLLLDVGADPRLLGPATSILGSDAADHLINQAHFKIPGDGVSFAWHQDSVHRRYGTPLWQDVNGRGSYVQALLAVDAMDATNGPLIVVPGSCNAGHMHGEGRKRLDSGLFPPETTVTLTLDAGDVVMFGPYTVHKSTANTSRRPRRALINGYAYPGANSRDYPGDGAGRRLRITDSR